jgi:hypothetical protein
MMSKKDALTSEEEDFVKGTAMLIACSLVIAEKDPPLGDAELAAEAFDIAEAMLAESRRRFPDA